MDTTTPRPDTSWRCPSTNPERPNARCWYPVGHHGRDAVNDWDLHQDTEGNQWPNPPANVQSAMRA
ncbi:MAG: hypothetical protein HOZ81_50325 [Streptomyces sp.]|nr:hypothetical protein [Streptomyces sp.]NUS24371.1 hypothetical protein [Streptomyces sp.]